MFRLALAAVVVTTSLADGSSLLQQSRNFPNGCAHGIKCQSGSCRCAEPGEIKRISPEMITKAGKKRSKTPAASQEAPKAAGEGGCTGKSILCKSSKSEENCNFWKRAGCSWGQASLQQTDKDFPKGCTHGVQCNEEGCRCAEPGEVKQITEDIEKQAPAPEAADDSADSCVGASIVCKALETEENCRYFQSEGCAWGQVDLLQKDRPKNCKYGILCHNGDCRCSKPEEIEGATPPEGACAGTSALCAKLTNEKYCTFFAKSQGCSWTKTASLVKDIEEVHASVRDVAAASIVPGLPPV